MMERERLALRQFREEQAEIERREREVAERPIREASERLNETARKLFAVERENILKLADPDIFVSPEVAGAKMSWDEAAKFNRTELIRFIRSTPDFYPSPANEEQLKNYFIRAGMKIITAEMWSRALAKLRQYNLIEERPEPEPPAEPQPEPIAEPEAPAPAPAQPEMFTGIDPATGLQRHFTAREVDRMTADEFRRCFELYGSRAPVFIDNRR